MGDAATAAAAAGAMTRSIPFSSRLMDACCIGLGLDVAGACTMYHELTAAAYTFSVLLPTVSRSAIDANHSSAYAVVSDDASVDHPWSVQYRM